MGWKICSDVGLTSINCSDVLKPSTNILINGHAARGPDTNLKDSAFIDKSIHEFIDSVNHEKVQRGRAASEMLSLKPVRDLKLANCYGRQYEIQNESFSGTARVFTRHVGDGRQLFALLALTRPGGEEIATQFLNSFKISD
jgi:hypothetical protein